MKPEFDWMSERRVLVRWLINYIRVCFCSHEWELIFNSEINGLTYYGSPNREVWHQKVYRCKKCGTEKRNEAFKNHYREIIEWDYLMK